MKGNSLNGDIMAQNLYVPYRYTDEKKESEKSTEAIDDQFIQEMIEYARHHLVPNVGAGIISYKNMCQYIKDWISILYEDFMINLTEEQVREMCSKKDESSIRKYCQNIISHSFER